MMNDNQVQLVLGALLHDIGKVIYRERTDQRKHSQSGYDYLKEEIGITEHSVLDCVRYHHADAMKHAKIDKQSLAYLVYIADNIASAVDRRSNDGEDVGFDISAPLETVFNILNGNHEKLYYAPRFLNPDEEINYPQIEKKRFDEYAYRDIKRNITDNLKGMEQPWNQDSIHSLLEVLEANLSFVPSSTSKSELADISLYDHLKVTAAVASCLYLYAEANDITDYRAFFYDGANDFYAEEAFYLYSFDISGIQKFIYTISTKNALKTLRARSFYLEIMMEHVIDNLLDKLQLSRVNCIYSGGGHCYLLLPNTEQMQVQVEEYLRSVNEWFLRTFQTSLYIAGGGAACATNTLKNEPEGSYADLYRTISRKISVQKSRRYTARDIRYLNHLETDNYGRECSICKCVQEVNEEGKCVVCQALEAFSQMVLKGEFFSVTLRQQGLSLPLPGGYYLVADDKERLQKRVKNDPYFVRAYSKNRAYTGCVTTKLWVGDYATGDSFETLAESKVGIKRLGVLRADVDNLGQAFVDGFAAQHATLSRTATFSRQLSLFFKLYINRILRTPKYVLSGDKCLEKRQATIVYSGGDDLFIVGNWSDVIELAIDLREAFAQYSQNTLTLSAGIGIYDSGYPISAMASEVEQLVNKSKDLPQKDAITLFEDGVQHQEQDGERMLTVSDGTYRWKTLINKVFGEKLRDLDEFLSGNEDYGMSFMYHLLELIRNRDEKINYARCIYLLARMEPSKDASSEQKRRYKEFSRAIQQWLLDETACIHLKTAMNVYAYLKRAKEDDYED